MTRQVLALVLVAALGIAAWGCSSNEEPSENQKTLVPEAANGQPVTKEGDRFSRQSDRN